MTRVNIFNSFLYSPASHRRLENSDKNNKMRDYSLDVIRLIACSMIVLMHSPMSGLGTSGAVLCGISYLTAPGIGLFFMVSGALLLRGHSGKLFDTKGFLQRRFSKILIPVIVWSLVGWGLDALGAKNAELSILWFMYCLAGMYLMTPILSRWLNMAGKKEIEFYLLLWMVTMCVPFAKMFVPIDESDTSWLYYFHGYVGYYVLGFYLQNYLSKDVMISNGRRVVFTIMFVAISVVFPVALFVLHAEVDFYSLFWYLSITIALWCIVWWCVVKRLMRNVSKIPNWIVDLSKLSFGIYLIHILVMRNLLWKTEWMQNMNGLVQIVVCAILTFTIGALISWGISKIKYVRAIIGY